MSRAPYHTFTKLVDEAFFIACGRNLLYEGVQVATILSVDDVWLEVRTQTTPSEEWEVVAGLTFGSLQVLDDGTYEDAMVAGVLEADPDASPAPGDGYMILAQCTVQFTEAYGGGTSERVFRRPARIVASAATAPASWPRTPTHPSSPRARRRSA